VIRRRSVPQRGCENETRSEAAMKSQIVADAAT
jgi:hypothetical protein